MSKLRPHFYIDEREVFGDNEYRTVFVYGPYTRKRAARELDRLKNDPNRVDEDTWFVIVRDFEELERG